MANLVRVLEATLKGPRRSSQRPTNPRPHTDQGGTASAGDRTDFQPGTGRPTGGTETNPDAVYNPASDQWSVPLGDDGVLFYAVVRDPATVIVLRVIGLG